MGLHLPSYGFEGCLCVPEPFMLTTPGESNGNPASWSWVLRDHLRGVIMSQLSKMRQSRNQWRAKAQTRGQGQRDQRQAHARLRLRYHQVTETLKATQARVRQLEAQLQALATRPKVEVVHLALQLFLEARISFRAVSRVLALLAGAPCLPPAPGPPPTPHLVIPRPPPRMGSAPACRGLARSAAPPPHGV